MSYDLRIWEQPADEAVPVSFEAAVRIWMKLENLAPGPNPKFAALAERMMELASGDDSPWIGDPVEEAKDIRSAVWSFSLPSESRLNLMHGVVRRANALDLTVMDDQLGMVFLPPDRVLPPESAETWQAAADDLDNSGWRWAPAESKSWSLASARRAIGSSLAAILEPHGFVAELQPAKSPYYHQKPFAVYSRTTSVGGQTVMFLGQTDKHKPLIIVDVNVFSTAIADITRYLFPELGESYARRQLVFRPGLFYGKSVYEQVESLADAQPLLRVMGDTVMAVLELTRTAPGLEAVLRGTVEFPFPRLASTAHWGVSTLAEHAQQSYGYAALISAWLHGSEQFEILRAARDQSDQKNFPPAVAEEKRLQVDRVATYLRERVQRGTATASDVRGGPQ